MENQTNLTDFASENIDWFGLCKLSKLLTYVLFEGTCKGQILKSLQIYSP
jgi:hypothetical protein